MLNIKSKYSAFLILFLLLAAYACNSNDLSDAAVIDQSGNVHPWTNLKWNNNPENFQFAIVTDRTGGNRPGVFEQGIEKFNLLQPEFVISVGDLIGGYTEDTVSINNQWDEFDSLVSHLHMPFFYVPGNHDLTNQVMENVWKRRLGATYYSFIYRNVLFLALNGEEGFDAHTNSFYSEEQREFVRRTLDENPDVRWTLVFMHKPIWEDTAKSKSSGWSEIESMLKGRKHTVFAGHHHTYKHYKRNNTSYIKLATTGGGSSLRGPMYGEFDHIVWVTMTDEGPVISNLMLEGIWDEDFSAEDVKSYLELILKGQAVREDTDFDEEKAAEGVTTEFKLFNKLDIPMKVALTFTPGKYLKMDPVIIEKKISPNSVEKAGTKLKTVYKNADEKELLIDELNHSKAKYTITYEFEKYGNIVVEGSVGLFK